MMSLVIAVSTIVVVISVLSRNQDQPRLINLLLSETADVSAGGKSGRGVLKWAQVTQALSAQLEDELSLKVGQVVKVTHVIDKDWYR